MLTATLPTGKGCLVASGDDVCDDMPDEGIILDNTFAFAHPQHRDLKEWFISQSVDLTPNAIFEEANNKGLGERYCAAFKTLQRERRKNNDVFMKIIHK